MLKDVLIKFKEERKNNLLSQHNFDNTQLEIAFENNVLEITTKITKLTLEINNRDLKEALTTGLSRPEHNNCNCKYHLNDFAKVIRGIATGANDARRRIILWMDISSHVNSPVLDRRSPVCACRGPIQRSPRHRWWQTGCYLDQYRHFRLGRIWCHVGEPKYCQRALSAQQSA